MSNDSNFEVVKNKVLAVLKIHPMMSNELASHCGYKSSTGFKRDYLIPLEAQGLIEKVQGSSRFQIKGQKATTKSIIVDLTSKDDFYNTDVIKQWRSRNNSKMREANINIFRTLCLGQLKKQGSDAPIDFKKIGRAHV